MRSRNFRESQIGAPSIAGGGVRPTASRRRRRCTACRLRRSPSLHSYRLISLPPTCCTPHRHRLEEVYLVYTAEKNRGLTLRLHTMLIAAWAAGALKTVGQAMQAYQL